MLEENNKERTKQQRKLILQLAGFVALSLILHALFFSAVLRKQFGKHVTSFWQAFQQQLSPEQQKEVKAYLAQRHEKKLKQLHDFKKISAKNKNTLPAQLRAPHSEFGWVLFDEPASNQQTPHKNIPDIPTTQDGTVGQARSPIATEGTAKPVSAPRAQAPKSAHVSPPPKTKTPVTAVKAQKASPVGTKDFEEIKSTQERIAHIKKLQDHLDAYQANAQALPTAMPPITLPQATERMIGGPDGIRVRGARSIDPKPKRNIIALTKGFIEKHEGPVGTDLIDRDGDPNKRPSFEELKYLSYESHISWCLQAAWKQNFERRPMAKPLVGDAFIEFYLDEHGKLVRHALLKSTGSKELDRCIIKSLELASPFPPVPKHFGVKTYKTARRILVTAENRAF